MKGTPADGGLPNQFEDVYFPPEQEKPLYHGTKRAYKDFNPRKGDKTDFLGNWLHFAEDPEHAARVPLETDLPVGEDGLVDAKYLDPKERPKPDYMTAPDSEVAGLNVRPTNVQRVNPLDVTHPFLNKKIIDDAQTLLDNIPQGSWGRMFLGQALNSAKHYMKPEIITKRGAELAEIVPDVARNLRDEMLRAVQNHPEAAKNGGFDALRYIDQPGWGENYSIAVPSGHQAKSSIKRRTPK